MKNTAPVTALLCALLLPAMAIAAPAAPTAAPPAVKAVTQDLCSPDDKPGLRLMIRGASTSGHIEFLLWSDPRKVPLDKPMSFEQGQSSPGVMMHCVTGECSQTSGKLTVSAISPGQAMEGEFAWTDPETKKESKGKFKSVWDRSMPGCKS
jgi:hypothetical protein